MKAINELTPEEVIKWVNKDFRIKVNGYNFIGESLSLNVGFSGLLSLLEEGDQDPEHAKELTLRICKKALESMDDVYVKKLRRGLKIRFYTK